MGLITRNDRDKTLIGGAEHFSRDGAEGLGPREARPACHRYHAALCINDKQGLVGPEYGHDDALRHRIDPTRFEIERQQGIGGRRDEQRVGLHIEAHHPGDGRKPPTGGDGHLRECGKAVGSNRAALSGEAERQRGMAGPGDDPLLNYLL